MTNPAADRLVLPKPKHQRDGLDPLRQHLWQRLEAHGLPTTQLRCSGYDPVKGMFKALKADGQGLTPWLIASDGKIVGRMPDARDAFVWKATIYMDLLERRKCRG